MKRLILYYVIGLLFFQISCVSVKKYDELKDKYDKCYQENNNNKAELQKFLTENNELKANKDILSKRINQLQKDTSEYGILLRKKKSEFDELKKKYDDLNSKYEQMLKGSATETAKLSSKLQTTEESLLKKEDELKALQKLLENKKLSLDSLERVIKKAQEELKQKEKRVNELESILNRKDSTVRQLKKKVSDALLGFENKGLTIETKNGKVYVSMDEKLLFASGSYEVSERGAEALKKLGEVLASNTDINIMVEGHTDNVPYKGAGQLKDNWDLSVMRATSVVKIILQNKNIDPKRISAAGRGEYYPIDNNNTPEARAKNRRTEIILTPKLDELFKILETN